MLILILVVVCMIPWFWFLEHGRTRSPKSPRRQKFNFYRKEFSRSRDCNDVVTVGCELNMDSISATMSSPELLQPSKEDLGEQNAEP